MSWLPRLLGLATAGYGAVAIAKPEVLAKPCQLTDADGRVPGKTRTAITAVCVRDLVSGLAMAFAPNGRALKLAIAVRVASDASDAVVFTMGARDPDARKKIVAAALGWSALCALSALTVRD